MEIHNHPFPNITNLDKFWNEARSFLKSNIVSVKYPASLRGNSNTNWDEWNELVGEMRNLNGNLLNSLHGTCGVYGIFTRTDEKSSWEVKYIGHTSTSKQRITNHLFTKHEKTGAKLADVKSALEDRKEVGVAFLNIVPGELRTYVEMKLIDSLRPEWNLRGKSKIRITTSKKKTTIEKKDGARTVVLISCVKTQLPTREAARDLFISTLFRYSLEYAYKGCEPDLIFILSAKYGLLELDDIIEPYDVPLSKMPVPERKEWSNRVLVQLTERCDLKLDHFVILAGKYYWQYLVPDMSSHEIPMRNHRIGEKSKFLIEELATV